MENKQSLTLTSSSQLANVPVQAIAEVLKLSALARTSADTLLTPAEFTYIAEEVQKDFPVLNLAQLKAIINNGIKGLYAEDGFNVINMPTIYRWLKKGEAAIRKAENERIYKQQFPNGV